MGVSRFLGTINTNAKKEDFLLQLVNSIPNKAAVLIFRIVVV